MSDAPAAAPRKPVVLLIEDEDPVRRPIVLVFNRMGYEVIEANSAASGREQ